MIRPMSDPRHRALAKFLISQRLKAGLRQVDLAKKLRRRQSYISHVETGQKVVAVVELLHWADAIGFEPCDAIKQIKRNGKR
jgi:transcriptional regulator with XRE-family HTH domain